MSENASKTILIVEDDPFIRDAYRLLLEDAGYEVIEAATGGQALSSAADRPPAVVLLDLTLPDVPGLDVARALTHGTSTREIPIIAITGHAGAEEQRRSLEAGCRACYVKPIPPKELLHQLSLLTTA
jgi:CheY-like chemotaxis protein